MGSRASLAASSVLMAGYQPVNVAEALAMLVRNSTGLSVYPYFRPQSVGEQDCITYTISRRTHTEILDQGSAGQGITTITFKCYSYVYSSCVTMAELIRDALDDNVGMIGLVNIEALIYQSDRHLIDTDNADFGWLNSIESDYEVRYIEPIPIR